MMVDYDTVTVDIIMAKGDIIIYQSHMNSLKAKLSAANKSEPIYMYIIWQWVIKNK